MTENITAPTKVCPHCGAQAQTLDNRCPNCNKKYKKRTLLKIFVGLCVLGLTAIIGCAALIGGAAHQAQTDSDKHAITQAQYGHTELGATLSSVKAQFGTPNTSDSYASKFGDVKVGETCVYYNEKGRILSVFQFCFDQSGKLDSKNSV